MTFGTVIPKRLLASCIGLALAVSALAPATVAADALDPELQVTLELNDGFLVYQIEPGTLNFLDEGGRPLAIEVIDGCAINDHHWLFAADLSGVPIQLSVRDLDSRAEARPYLAAFEPGKPVDAMLDPAALSICGEYSQVGGLPRLDATVTLTSARDDGQDGAATISLLSDGAERAYQRLVQGDYAYRILERGSPVAAIDESPDFDRLYLLTEGRTPRTVEGIVFSGNEGMLPAERKLEKALRKITDARVRRAFEAAKGGKVPAGIIKDLGLRKVQRVHHADLDFETLGWPAALTRAGWIREGAVPVQPPALVEERFTVELASADGERTPVPLRGPVKGSAAAGNRWDYQAEGVLAQVIDACDTSDTFWIWAGARTDEPLELVVTEVASGETVTLLLWTERRGVSRLTDTSSLAFCP